MKINFQIETQRWHKAIVIVIQSTGHNFIILDSRKTLSLMTLNSIRISIGNGFFIANIVTYVLFGEMVTVG